MQVIMEYFPIPRSLFLLFLYTLIFRCSTEVGNKEQVGMKTNVVIKEVFYSITNTNAKTMC